MVSITLNVNDNMKDGKEFLLLLQELAFLEVVKQEKKQGMVYSSKEEMMNQTISADVFFERLEKEVENHFEFLKYEKNKNRQKCLV